MKRASLLVFMLVFMAAFTVETTVAVSCKAGRVGCIASCAAQNCATGYCDKGNTCVCRRCGEGSILGK